MSFNNNDAY